MFRRALTTPSILLLVALVLTSAPLSTEASVAAPAQATCGRWVPVNVPASRLSAVDVVSADDVWAVGPDGKIVHWDGVQWNDVASPTAERLLGISMIPSTPGECRSLYLPVLVR